MQILDYGKNGHFSKDLQIFLNRIFKLFFLIFFVFLMLKLNKLIKNEEIFDNLSFFSNSDQGFNSKRFFFFVFCNSLKTSNCWFILCPLDPDPWIGIFLRIRIQEAKVADPTDPDTKH